MYKRNLLLQSFLWSFALGAQTATATDNQPNVVLINIDDMGWTDLSCNGSSYYETPYIDALRNAGVWFSQAYAGAANSAPSRACMLTGLNTPRHGIYTVKNSDRGKSSNRRLIPIVNTNSLPDGFQTLPRVLHESGYQVFHVGKWHVTDNPLTCGVDVNIGGNHMGHPRSYFSPFKNPNLPDKVKGEYLCDRIGDEAVNLIMTADKSKPFFLYYATYAVHSPLMGKPEKVAKYKAKAPTKAHNNPVYAALIESMDENVGKVLAALKESGRFDNTLIVFTTDNGGVYNTSKQWPLRAGKGSYYEGGIRVPFIVYQKGKFEKGEIDDVAVSQMDIFPTLVDLLGIDDKNLKMDGRSLAKLLKKGKDKSLNERPIVWHAPIYLEGGNNETTDPIFRTRPVSVVRKGDWKLIQNYETDSYELYNLKKDISEVNNLAAVHPEKVKELVASLDKWKKETNALVPTELNPEYKPR